MLAVEPSSLLCRACMLVFALGEGAKLECVCDRRLSVETSVYTRRLPAETGTYIMRMVYDKASMGMFFETGGYALSMIWAAWRLAMEHDTYTLLMVYDSAFLESSESLTRLLFRETSVYTLLMVFDKACMWLFTETGGHALLMFYDWAVLRLPTESGAYTLLMVYVWASLETLTRLLFREYGEERKLSKKRSVRCLMMTRWCGCSWVTQTSRTPSAFFLAMLMKLWSADSRKYFTFFTVSSVVPSSTSLHSFFSKSSVSGAFSS